jgi:hypothetical protein
MENIWIKKGFSRHLECKTFMGWMGSCIRSNEKFVPK